MKRLNRRGQLVDDATGETTETLITAPPVTQNNAAISRAGTPHSPYVLVEGCCGSVVTTYFPAQVLIDAFEHHWTFDEMKDDPRITQPGNKAPITLIPISLYGNKMVVWGWLPVAPHNRDQVADIPDDIRAQIAVEARAKLQVVLDG